MGILWAILTWAFFGLIAGVIARFLVPGRQSMSILSTIVLGVLGSLAGGFVAWIFVGGSPLQPSGFLPSIVGATALLAIYGYRQSRMHLA